MKKENLLLLHGALGSKHQLKKLSDILKDSFDVSTINFEGHGDRFSDRNFSIEGFAQNVHQWMNDEKIESTYIFGYSMGGYVALKYALMHPEKVKSIVTLGTKFHWTEEAASKEVKMLNPQKVEEKVPAFAAYLDKMHTRNNWKDVMSKTADMMISMGRGEKLHTHDLNKIDHDVLICLGELDNMVTMEESQRVASLLPNGRLKQMKNFQHPIEKIDFDEMAETIKDFLIKST